MQKGNLATYSIQWLLESLNLLA